MAPPRRAAAGAARRLGLDPDTNPDLVGAGRSAEGSIEWLELLKRARAEKEARDKEPAVAEGSVGRRGGKAGAAERLARGS